MKPEKAEGKEKKARLPQGEVQRRAAALDARRRAITETLKQQIRGKKEELLQAEPRFQKDPDHVIHTLLVAREKKEELHPIAKELLQRYDLARELKAAYEASSDAYKSDTRDLEASVVPDGSGAVWATLEEYRAREQAILDRVDVMLAKYEEQCGITPPQPATAPLPEAAHSAFDVPPSPLSAPPEAVAIPAASDVVAAPVMAAADAQPVPVSAVPDAFGYRVGQTRTRFEKESHPGAKDGFRYIQTYEGGGNWRLVSTEAPPHRVAEIPLREKSPPRTGPGAPVGPDGSPDYSTPERTLRTIARLVAPSMPIGRLRGLETKSRWTAGDWEEIHALDAQVRDAARRAGVPDSMLNQAAPRTPHETRRFIHLVVRAADYPAQVVMPEPQPAPEQAPAKEHFAAPPGEGMPTDRPSRPESASPAAMLDEFQQMKEQGIAEAPSKGIGESLATFLEKLGTWWNGLWGEKNTEAAVSPDVSAEATPEQQTPVLHELTEAEKRELIQGYSKAYEDIDKYQQGKINPTDMTGLISSWEVMSAKEAQHLMQGLSPEEIQKVEESGMLRLPLQKITVGIVALMGPQDYEALRAEVGAHIKRLGGTVPEQEEETQDETKEEEKVTSATERSTEAQKVYESDPSGLARDVLMMALRKEMKVIDSALLATKASLNESSPLLAWWQDRRKTVQAILNEHEQFAG